MRGAQYRGRVATDWGHQLGSNCSWSYTERFQISQGRAHARQLRSSSPNVLGQQPVPAMDWCRWSTVYTLQSAAACCGPSCGPFFPTGAQSAKQSVSPTAVQQRQWAYISRLCGAMRPRCVTTILVGGRAGSSNWFRIQFPVDRYAGGQGAYPSI